MIRMLKFSTPKMLVFLAFVLFLVLISIVIAQKVDARGGDPLNGKEHYNIQCQSCHGNKGHGDGPVAESLPKKPSNIANKLKRFYEFDTLIISQVIMKGKLDKSMPAYKDILSEQDAKDILAYIRSIN